MHVLKKPSTKAFGARRAGIDSATLKICVGTHTYPKPSKIEVGMGRYPHPPTHWGEHFGYYLYLPTQGYFTWVHNPDRDRRLFDRAPSLLGLSVGALVG